MILNKQKISNKMVYNMLMFLELKLNELPFWNAELLKLLFYILHLEKASSVIKLHT